MLQQRKPLKAEGKKEGVKRTGPELTLFTQGFKLITQMESKNKVNCPF
jgi:hypothetical protein